jgi:Polyketide cyclase / dehydrase and lipid transport
MKHHEESALINAIPDELFAYLDDPARLGAHMSKPSWRMGGGSMRYEVDGQATRLSGKVFGMALEVTEVVVLREPPLRKAWETTGTPKLLVVGAYRMGFDIEPRKGGSGLRVYIDYALPARTRSLGRLLGAYYARWCTRRMVDDAERRFADARVP